jgi:hypothetical protein
MFKLRPLLIDLPVLLFELREERRELLIRIVGQRFVQIKSV